MYRLRIIEHGFINFDAHPVSGVFFCLYIAETALFKHPKGCFLFFVESPRNISYNGKSSVMKGDFMSAGIITPIKRKRGCL